MTGETWPTYWALVPLRDALDVKLGRTTGPLPVLDECPTAIELIEAKQLARQVTDAASALLTLEAPGVPLPVVKGGVSLDFLPQASLAQARNVQIVKVVR